MSATIIPFPGVKQSTPGRAIADGRSDRHLTKAQSLQRERERFRRLGAQMAFCTTPECFAWIGMLLGTIKRPAAR